METACWLAALLAAFLLGLEIHKRYRGEAKHAAFPSVGRGVAPRQGALFGGWDNGSNN
jgi:hypothetical protein